MMQHHIPEGRDVQKNCYGNLKSCKQKPQTLNVSHNQGEGDIICLIICRNNNKACNGIMGRE